MKKINAFFLAVLFLVLCSCATEEHTKNIIKTPDQMMGVLKVSPLSGEISATDEISIYAPQGAADAKLYYEIAVGVDCEEPTEKSTQYKGEFTISSTSLQPTDGDIITLKILAVKDGYEDGTLKVSWYYTDGKSNPPNDNAYLKSVTISGADFTFSSDLFVYDDIKVPNEIESVSLDYTKSDSGATVMEGVQSLQNITLTAGETKIVTLTVIASDKKTKKNYTFSIYRAKGNEDIKSSDCTLASLNVDGVSIAFDKNQTTYDVTFLNSIETTSVTYKLSNDKAKVVTTPANLTNISLTAGQKVDVSITVTAEDPNYSRIYNISLYREPDGPLSDDATLKSLSVTGGTLSFNPATTQYNVIIPANYAEPVSVTYEKNHLGASITTIPSNLNNISIAPGTEENVHIIVTAENKIAKETYKVEIKKEKVDLDDNANLSSITLSAGSLSFDKNKTEYDVTVENSVSSIKVTADAESSNATVTVTPSESTPLTENVPQLFTIDVIAQDGTPKKYSVTVTRKGDDNPPPPPPPAGDYYWTNKDDAVGTNKTISSLSSWSESDKIIQGVACDTPRCWLGGHEYPDPDLYAMFAAWDDTNLYLMIEIPNVDNADAVDNDKCYAGSQFLPMGIVMNTGKRTPGDGTLTDGNSVWQGKKLYSWTAIDTMLMFHPRLNIGEPSVFMTDSTGKFTYTDKTLCVGFKLAGVERNVYFNESVSANMWAAVTDSEGNWGGKSSTDMSTYTYVDYKASGKKMSSYQLTIPLASIGIDKNYIESVGISVGAFSTYGASAMDCLPWDDCMIDCAAESYSSDPSSSKEKEDIDELSYLARVGKM